MRKLFLVIPLIILAMTASGQTAKSFYDFKVQTIDGADFNFSSLKGKKVMIINTASKCGNTPQYAELEKLYQQYGGDKFVIIGFPANNFGAQEPGTYTEIKEFCTKNYGVTFPMMSKISVKGSDMHELYKWLTSKSRNGLQDSEVKWNFQKYLVNETGKLVKVVDPRTQPMDPVILDWLNSK
jgi:glutathione peroxidase